MRSIRALGSVLLLGAAVLLSSGAAAAAEGIAAAPAQIAEPARASLAKEIAAYRAAHPEAFEAVRSVKGHRPEVYRSFRNPIPMVGRELKRLGPSALLPMLEALAFDAPARGSLTDEEWTALAVGMLEAVGAIRDPRSGPVVRAVFEGAATSDPKSMARREPVQRAAAQAMGQLCGNDELAALIKRTAAPDPLRAPAILGLGHCMRPESAKHLAGLLAAAPDAAAAAQIASALGMAGSSWAWKALGPSAEKTGSAVRETAARALVAAFVRHAGARAEMRKAIVLVSHASTPELITNARISADAETKAALDTLVKQLR